MRTRKRRPGQTELSRNQRRADCTSDNAPNRPGDARYSGGLEVHSRAMHESWRSAGKEVLRFEEHRPEMKCAWLDEGQQAVLSLE